MYIPVLQTLFGAGMFAGIMKKGKQGEISSGEILDFCNEGEQARSCLNDLTC
jgi:hypothetical protein